MAPGVLQVDRGFLARPESWEGRLTLSHFRLAVAEYGLENVSGPIRLAFSGALVRGLDLEGADGSGIAVLPELSTGVRWSEDGSVELMVARNAVVEACDLLGGEGHDPDRRAVGFALRRHPGSIDLIAEALGLLPAPAVALGSPSGPDGGEAVLVRLDGGGYVVSSAKRADRGEGVIVRLIRTGEGEVELGPGLVDPGSLVRTDLLERDLGPVESPVSLDAPLVTLRIVQ